MYDVVNRVALSKQEAAAAAGAGTSAPAWTTASRDFDELQILLRKQLTNSMPKYACYTACIV